jgi:hypothetical protein
MIKAKQNIKKLRSLFLLFVGFLMITSCDSSSEKSSYSVAYKSKGDSLSTISQQVLLSNVGREMKAGGPVQALEFCNVNASRIMDSLSKFNSVKISRVTDKPRNKNNQANAFELDIMKDLEASNSFDTLVESKGAYTYYKSINLGMTTCLKCHGSIEEISRSTSDMIKVRYPNDQAIGYKLGDYRGAWKIMFE